MDRVGVQRDAAGHSRLFVAQVFSSRVWIAKFRGGFEGFARRFRDSIGPPVALNSNDSESAECLPVMSFFFKKCVSNVIGY